jgi:hypothetical protein
MDRVGHLEKEINPCCPNPDSFSGIELRNWQGKFLFEGVRADDLRKFGAVLRETQWGMMHMYVPFFALHTLYCITDAEAVSKIA